MVLVTVALVGAAGLAIDVGVGPAVVDDQLSAGARHMLLGLASATALFTSLVYWICHRQSGRAPELWMAAAFGVVAGSIALDGLVTSPGPSMIDGVAAADLRTATFVSVLGLVVRSLLGPEVDTRITTGRAAIGVAAMLVVSTAVIAGALRFVHGVLHVDATDSVRAVHAVTIGLWVSAAFVLMRGHEWHSRLVTASEAAVFGFLSVAAWTYVGADLSELPALTVLAVTMAAGIALAGGLRELHRRAAIQNRVGVGRRLEAAAHDEALRGERERRAATDHDLRSGLLAIEAALEKLATTGSDADANSVASAAGAEATRLRRLLAATGERSLPRVVDMRDTIGPVLLLERSRAVDLHVDVDEAVRVCVAPDALITVLRVLLDNARRHAPLARVEVSARTVDDRALLVVRDFACVVQPAIEYPARLPGDIHRDSEPHGIGLLSARRLIEQYGGTLSVDEGDERGLAFVIDLPTTDASVPAEPRAVADVGTTDPTTAVMRRRSDALATRRDVAVGRGAV